MYHQPYTQQDASRFVGVLRESETVNAAAVNLGVSARQLRKVLSRFGYDPPSHYLPRDQWVDIPVDDEGAPDTLPSLRQTQLQEPPDGFHLKKVSTHSTYEDGVPKVRQRWVSHELDKETKTRNLLEACKALLEPLEGRAKPVSPPRMDDRDLLSVYPIGDHHHGMYAWSDETGGEDHNILRSEELLAGAIDKLVGLAPEGSEALIINLGDFFHADNSQNRTGRSGHALDVDTRYARVMRTGIHLMQRCIDRTLERHRTVRVICEIGNHDDHSALVLAIALEMFYRNEPRVLVDTSPAAFHWVRFGQCLIGVTHGDGAKMEKLPGIMAHDRKEDWGVTTYRYWYTGHVHHQQAKEFPGCVVESFRTLSPRDAWHSRAGYRSGQDMRLDVLHKDYGRIVRHIVGVEQLRPKGQP